MNAYIPKLGDVVSVTTDHRPGHCDTQLEGLEVIVVSDVASSEGRYQVRAEKYHSPFWVELSRLTLIRRIDNQNEIWQKAFETFLSSGDMYQYDAVTTIEKLKASGFTVSLNPSP